MRERKRLKNEKGFKWRLVVRGCATMKKKHKARTRCRSRYHYFLIFLLVFLLAKKKERRKKERKNHRRDGLPAEGYDGAEQGHIFP